jgi:hypothetical protein
MNAEVVHRLERSFDETSPLSFPDGPLKAIDELRQMLGGLYATIEIRQRGTEKASAPELPPGDVVEDSSYSGSNRAQSALE